MVPRYGRILLLSSVLLNAVLFCLLIQPIRFSFIDSENITKNIDERLLPQKILRSPSKEYCKNLDMLVVVHTRLNSFSRRDMWRRTYGNSLLSRKYKYRVLFPLGIRGGVGRNKRFEEELEKETTWHGDILQSNFIDSYHNVSMKQLSHLRYFVENCDNSTVLLKIDDDAAWAVDKVHQLALGLQEKTNASIRCLMWMGMNVQKNPHNRWFVSEEEYNGTVYPHYCSGMTYMAQWAAAKKMVDVLPKMKFLWIDDVFITGMLTKKAGVAIDDISYMYDLSGNDTRFKNQQVVFYLTHRPETERMFHVGNDHLMVNERNPHDY